MNVSKKELDEVATKGFVMEAIDAVLQGMQNMFNTFETKMSGRFDNIDKRLTTIESDVKWIKNDINDLKLDTPTQKEFNDLKKRVDKFVPLN